MKTKIKAIAVLGAFVGALALTGCNGATPDKGGNILTYTDSNGNVVGYTAEELLQDYQANGSALSTQFDKIYEVLIRKYYSDPKLANVYQNIRNNAQNAVQSDMETAQNNATTNGTTYEAELQSILDSHNVENIDELLEYYIYNGTGTGENDFIGEKGTFETDFYADNIAAIRDGNKDGLNGSDPIFPESEEFGVGNEGWLKEETPYHVRHVLINVSASYSNFVTGEITQDDAKSLSTAVFSLAGDPRSGSSTRQTFGQIALSQSDDEGSATRYGDLGLMSDSYVNEFRLGIYAFESLYNKETTKAGNTYGNENVYRITPGLTQEATGTTEEDIDQDQTVGYGASQKTVYDFFAEGEKYDTELNGVSSGIGTIPYGAAVALATTAENGWERDENNQLVNDGVATTFPRNIIFNKYFNKHNVCVITPNDIAFNDSRISDTLKDGVYKPEYGAIPGFQVDTTEVLPQFEHNVLTNERGQIILAVRAGTADYTGIHFMVIERSGLSQYGSKLDGGKLTTLTAEDDKVADLSEYYTLHTESESGYPKDNDGNNLATYVNFNTQTITGGSSDNNQTSRVSTIRSEIEGYSDAISTYIFQQLMEGGTEDGAKIEFLDDKLEADMQRYIRLRRTAADDDEFETLKDAWSTYAELLTAQESARTMGYDADGNVTTGRPNLVPERCAIGFKSHSGADWEEGGVCYYAQ